MPAPSGRTLAPRPERSTPPAPPAACPFGCRQPAQPTLRAALPNPAPQSPYHCNLLVAGYDKGVGASLYWLDYLATLHKVNTGGTGYGGSGARRARGGCCRWQVQRDFVPAALGCHPQPRTPQPRSAGVAAA